MILNYSSNENERDEVNALSRQIAIPIHIGLELAHVNTSFTFHFRPLHRSNFSIREGNLARSRGTAHEKMYNLPGIDTKERIEKGQVRSNREFHPICNGQIHVPSVYLAAKFSFRGWTWWFWWWPPLLERAFQFPLSFTRVELWNLRHGSHAGDIVVLRILDRGVLPPRRMHTVMFSNIRVFQKLEKFQRNLWKKKYQLSRVTRRRRRREDKFLLIWKLRFQEESLFLTNQPTRFGYFERLPSLLRARREPLFFSLDTFYLVISDVVG